MLHKESEKGFTLMEMLIVVTIISILAGIVLPRFVGSSDSAKKSVHKSQRQTINTQLELYELNEGDMPTAMTDIQWGGDPAYITYWPEGVPTACVYGTAWEVNTTTKRVQTDHDSHE